jgi:DNA excision repair protein ERCC-4
VSSLGKEKRAFEQLITAKETLVVNLPDHIEDIEREKIADRDMDLVDTRAINKMKESASLRLKVVVDVRDFRSSLPSLLYAGGFTVIPRTLLVKYFLLRKYDFDCIMIYT